MTQICITGPQCVKKDVDINLYISNYLLRASSEVTPKQESYFERKKFVKW
jgi:hypothetical protein